MGSKGKEPAVNLSLYFTKILNRTMNNVRKIKINAMY